MMTLAILVLLIILSGIFSGAEIALVSLSKAHVRAMQEAKLPMSSVIARLKQNPNRLLITILIGNNLVNISASVVATVWATNLFGEESLGYVTGVLTLFILVFGEIFPKTIAQKYAQRFAQIIAQPLWLLEKILYPLIFLLETLLNKIIVRLHSEKEPSHITSLHEVKAMIELAVEDGHIEENVEELLSNLFVFDKTSVKKIMTPAKKMVTIVSSATIEELRELFLTTARSRIPVYTHDHEKIIGIVTVRLLLDAQKHDYKNVGDLNLEPAIFVPSTTLIDDLLLKFQELKSHIALVVEKESVIGLVTMENVLEEIVGEIFDETEKNRSFVVKESDGCLTARYDTPLDEIRKYFSSFEEDEPRFRSLESLFYEKTTNHFDENKLYAFEGYTIKIKKFDNGRPLSFTICQSVMS